MLGIVRQDGEEAASGAARVFTFFRDRLLSGELKTGDRLLPERELSLALGVSRPVLREALRSLSMLGLLDTAASTRRWRRLLLAHQQLSLFK